MTPEHQDPARPRRRKWLWLGLALAFCCGAPFIWVPFMAVGGWQAGRLRERLQPGMSVEEVLGHLDETELWSLGLSNVSAFPRRPAGAPTSGEDSGCPADRPLGWSARGGAPWGRGTNPTREDAARRLARCDTIEFRLVVPVSRFGFVVTLKDGRVVEVSPLSGQFE